MKRSGIWIDQREANIITFDETTLSNKTIYSDVESRIRIEGEGKKFGRFGDQYTNDEKGKQNRNEQLLQRFLSSVAKQLNHADEIIIFGPAQTKNKLEKLIGESPDLQKKLINTLVSENMTHNQKVAFVRDYFKLDQ